MFVGIFVLMVSSLLPGSYVAPCDFSVCSTTVQVAEDGSLLQGTYVDPCSFTDGCVEPVDNSGLVISLGGTYVDPLTFGTVD